MEENAKLNVELNKILFLAGINSAIINEAAKKREQQAVQTVQNRQKKEKEEPEQKEIENLKNSEAKNNVLISDYLRTNEEDYLTFPMKYAMVSGNFDTYLKDIKYIVETLKYEKVPLEKIVDAVSSGQKYDSSIAKIKDLKASTGIFLKALYNNYEKTKPGEMDIALKLNKGNEVSDYQKLNQTQKVLAQKDKYNDIVFEKNLKDLQRDFQTVTGDEKAIISYGFNRSANELKLTPLGFWQIQFLVRIFSGQPKKGDFLESVLFHSTQYNSYKNKAELVLRDFYKNTIFPMAAILTRRQFNINPNDHEFKIMLDNAIDKVMDSSKNSYDAAKNNFGAWAFTVARNHIIDEIKAIADYTFQDTEEILYALDANKIDYLDFKYDTSERIPKEYLKSSLTKEVNGKTIYRYIFNSPHELFIFLQENKDNQTVLKSLEQSTKTRLNNIKALHSHKKFADYNPEEGEEDREFNISTGKLSQNEKDKLFIELSNLYSERTKMSLSYDKLKETRLYRKVKTKDGQLAYSEDDLESAFKRDLGKAIYFYQTSFVSQFPYWIKTPPQNVKEEVYKYIMSLKKGYDATETWNIINNVNPATSKVESKREKKLANPMFYKNQDIKEGKVLDILQPYIAYSEGSARRLSELSDKLKEEFHVQQKEEKIKQKLIAREHGLEETPDPVYTLEDPAESKKLWQQVSTEGVSSLNLRIDKETSEEKGGTKSRKTLEYKQTELNKLHDAFLNAQLNNLDFSNQEIKNYAINFLNKKLAGKLQKQGLSAIPNTITPNDLMKLLESKSNYFVDLKKEKGFQDIIENVYNIKEKVRKYLNDTRYAELNRFSNIFSKLSGQDIQFEQKESSIDKINNYLLEIKNNFIKKILI